VSFLKGISIDDSFVIMDEAEDLNTKLIKLVGSRIGENSCIVFTGDWKQSENRYKQDNGLLRLIESSKGNPLVGIVVLEEDVRSSTSKLFAEL
jgi:PhoH-like ATPase